MKRKRIVNLPASVHQRLLALHQKSGEPHNVLLTRYALERFLCRLGATEHAKRFVLKGAMLFLIWTNKMHRPTKDLDLLGFLEPSSGELKTIFKDICNAKVEPDGLEFDAASVRIEAIREEQDYGGQRVRLVAHLGTARIPIQIDVGFGDAVTPRPRVVAFPALLDFPAPRLRVYPRETVVAEKFEAIASLGMENSRMKDFYDVWFMAQRFEFEGALLAKAIAATFKRRGTPLPDSTPFGLSDEFGRDSKKQAQWQGFIRKSALDASGLQLAQIIAMARAFLLPPANALAKNSYSGMSWPAGGPWRMSSK
ncbi:MAG: nucleotidyl transferase AbiEii/AbiGii toxin family protein [Planctomycetes bacterium]|nr:nucleotidyl transferase AbiEii/AbiGii toxin family protein [Planctomycetota bacterium]